ncbi:AAA family ATPase [Frankia sp. CiP3]|uniref:AAA family ATPase n=1 Tax=Frankia sp. CiP3 TaxID=2880971 RepID=UPI001EF4B0BA|nr:AAA family ATPase [Frankia sp. CiP3]
MVEPIDAAYERFLELKAQIASYADTIETEQDTRVKVIDRFFLDVLGWSFSELLTESPVTDGFIDYNFQVEGRSRLIVEAKKDGRSLGCEDVRSGKAYKLNGPVFRNKNCKEGIQQAIYYCGQKNAELACVTNGREWIIFRGNRLGDGQDTTSGMAFVFSSLNSVEEDFKLFYRLLDRSSAGHAEYRPYFQEAEGQPIRANDVRRPLRRPGSENLLPLGPLASDINDVMRSFFDRLSGDSDPGLLARCFVTTNESQVADRQLAKISEDLLTRIRGLDTADADALSGLIRRAAATKRNEFVVIVGTKGAGKSTFIERFFGLVLSPEIAKQCIVLRVNLASNDGDADTVQKWLDRELLRTIENTVFPDDPPEYNEIEGIFYDEYNRLRRGAWRELYESNHSQFRIDFGKYIEARREEQPHDYINGLIRHVVGSRKKLPVIVFDNADHFSLSFQEQVYQYARSIYEKSLCLIVLPVTDRTSWQMSRHGALQSFEHQALFLPTPPTETIIRARIDYLDQQIAEERSKPDQRYFVDRGISLSLDDLSAFTRSLQRVFLQTSDTAMWVGSFANHDVRRALRLARDFVTSPHLAVEDLIKAYIAENSVSIESSRSKRALIRGRYDIYPVERHEFVQNIFSLNQDLETTPLLGVRLLQALRDTPRGDHEGSFLAIDQLIEYCRAMYIEPRAVMLWLDVMLKSGLCLNYDPTVLKADEARRLELSPSGEQHLEWSKFDLEYASAMADVTPIADEVAYAKIQSYARQHQGGPAWRKKIAAFAEYLLAEDQRYTKISVHPAYDGQHGITNAFKALSDPYVLV